MTTPESFRDYARRAASGIDDRGDRRDAESEIVGHLLDAQADAVASGLSPVEAEAAALARMGEAPTITAPLEAAHTPRWRPGVVIGFVVAALILAAIPVIAAWLWIASIIGSP